MTRFYFDQVEPERFIYPACDQLELQIRRGFLDIKPNEPDTEEDKALVSRVDIDERFLTASIFVKQKGSYIEGLDPILYEIFYNWIDTIGWSFHYIQTIPREREKYGSAAHFRLVAKRRKA